MYKPKLRGGFCFLLAASAFAGCDRNAATSVSIPSTLSSPLAVESPMGTASAEQAPVTISNPTRVIGLSDEDAAAIVYEPVVALSAHHEETCKIRVEEQFPALELKTLDGQQASIVQEFGKQLTVIVFWNLQHPMGIEQLCRINDEVVKRFQNADVNVVTINVGDTADDVAGFIGSIECDATCLLDEESAAFDQVASGILPRTYLVDASGTVRWFDLEYSRSTRRELRNAVIYNLKTLQAATPDLM